MEPEHFQSLARYNQWANQRLYGACRALPEEAYHDRRDAAFFGSIHGTLNHILLGDRVWFDRVEGERTEGISSLDQILHRDFSSLAHARAAEDERIIEIAVGMKAARLGETIVYTNMAGEPNETRLDRVLTHVFNHQTHHRGQAHALVLAAGEDPPPLDLIYYLREIGAG